MANEVVVIRPLLTFIGVRGADYLLLVGRGWARIRMVVMASPSPRMVVAASIRRFNRFATSKSSGVAFQLLDATALTANLDALLEFYATLAKFG